MPETIQNIITFDDSTFDISSNWEGFLLNHLTKEDHPNHDKPHSYPDEVDWNRNIISGLFLESELVDYKFLYAAKKKFLTQNVESPDLVPLPNKIEISRIRYDYGIFTGMEAEHQDLVFEGWYKETPESTPILKPYKTLRNNLSNTGDKEKLVRWRINTAIAYIQERAKEIDLITAGIFLNYGTETAEGMGLQQLNLTQGIVNFFIILDQEMALYRNTGDLLVNTKIDEIMAQENPANLAWLKENIITGQENNALTLEKAGDVIKQNLQNAVTPVTAAEMANAVAEA